MTKCREEEKNCARFNQILFNMIDEFDMVLVQQARKREKDEVINNGHYMIHS